MSSKNRASWREITTNSYSPKLPTETVLSKCHLIKLYLLGHKQTNFGSNFKIFQKDVFQISGFRNIEIKLRVVKKMNERSLIQCTYIFFFFYHLLNIYICVAIAWVITETENMNILILAVYISHSMTIWQLTFRGKMAHFNHLSADPTKWSNTLKQFVG